MLCLMMTIPNVLLHCALNCQTKCKKKTFTFFIDEDGSNSTESTLVDDDEIVDDDVKTTTGRA